MDHINNDVLSNNAVIENKNSNIRNSGLEILRIIAMILIVMHHAVMFSGVNYIDWESYKILRFIEMGGKLGVNIFVLISSYFMCMKKFSIKRILNILVQTFIFSLSIFLIFLAFGKTELTLINVLNTLFPVIYGKWWFVSTYIVLLLISPALNLVIEKLTRKEHKYICIFSVLLIITYLYVNTYIYKYWTNISNYNELVWFTLLYLIAAYFRKYNPKIKKRNLIIVIIFIYGYQFLDTLLSVYEMEVFKENAIGNLVLSVSLVLLLKDVQFKNKTINAIASTTFGVYLIHEHNLMRAWWLPFIYKTVNGYINNIYIGVILTSIITFILCSIIYYIYLKLIHKYIMVGVDKILDKWKNQKSEIQKVN